ncbi:MAG TPA: ATP-binding protein, partial [Fimbriimonadaceae bacterium]|nr:ATP-binding protein [Fimbriimonadaceae bacterium]
MEPLKRLSPWHGYWVAVVAVAAAGILRMLLQPALGREYEFTMLLMAVVVAAWRGGFGPAILALILDCLVAGTIHGFRNESILPSTSNEAVGFLLYMIMGLAVAVLGESQQRALRAQHDESLRRAATIQELAKEVAKREQAQSELQKSQNDLIQVNASLEERVRERTNELTVALQELEGFTYSIAHDMRAPLRALNSTCRLIADEHGDSIDASGRELIDSAMRAANFMNSFVDDLLAYARLVRVPIRKTKLELTWLVQSVGSEIGGGDPTFEVRAQPYMEIVSDPYLTEVLFRELLDNAYKFRKPGRPGLVRIELRSSEEADRVSVTDRGIGFEMQYASKIFEPFQKLHRAVEYPGTGIGLAKAKRIVERLGGTIWAESEMGEGCSIEMLFPHRSQFDTRPADAAAMGI